MRLLTRASRLCLGLGLILMASCTPQEERTGVPEGDELIPIRLEGEINQVQTTRINDTGFCDGDRVGIYVVDYEGTTPGRLQDRDNHADNLLLTFDEQAYKWDLSRDLFFKDKVTPIDIYGYYPIGKPTEVEKYSFEVQKDQNAPAEGTDLSGYEASDFLWGKSENIAPTNEVIPLRFRHIMSGGRVTLREGTGFADGEWAQADKKVLFINTKRKAEINLSTGVAKAVGEDPATGTIPSVTGDDFRAIIVPQTIAASTPLVSITVDGYSYLFRKSESFTYEPGKLHNFTITVNKRQGEGLDFEVTSETITAWLSDPLSHDGKAREYMVIDVATPGTLKQAIADAGKELSRVKNLKLTGKINEEDYKVMRDEMPLLTNLNLKEVESRVIMPTYRRDGNVIREEGQRECLAIPVRAFERKENLMRIVLPDRLEEIGYDAFHECKNLTGSLILPEGLKRIGSRAFRYCSNLTGKLYLPTTLVSIGEDTQDGGAPYNTGAFVGCCFTGALVLPDHLEYIGDGSFCWCREISGELRIPESVSVIARGAFEETKKLRGNLIIPQGITEISEEAFYKSGLDGVLVMHNGINKIGQRAFANTSLKGELALPKSLELLGEDAFSFCDFSGQLLIPENLSTLASGVFRGNWRLMGTVVIPEGVESIGAEAFAYCRSLEQIVIEEGVSHIGSDAFKDCFGINGITCKSAEPADVSSGAFDGVPKDNFTLEVPEHAIQQYAVASGWKDFKRISAYHNLVIRPRFATAINSRATRQLTLNAEGPWQVESKPDWVSLDKTGGNGKAELQLTFSEMPHGNEMREGEVVFRLSGKEYRTRCHVTQYDYEHGEDEMVALRKASKGKGVNIVILGDGFSAKDIAEGKLMKAVKEADKHFFDIEPYKSYAEYFNVYAGIPVSQESGVGTVNTIVYNRFNTTAKLGVQLGGRNGESDAKEIMRYATKAPTVSEDNLHETLIIMVANTAEYGGICYMYDGGEAIAYCPMSNYGYPFDFRGVVQHEAGGHGFGKLGDEYIYHNNFIDGCPCTCCPHVRELNDAKAKGWYVNLSLSGKRTEVDWSHLLMHDKYKQIVDVYEGGHMHARGVYRSELNSCMNNDVPYFNTISREEMVKRIMRYAGEPFSYKDFVAKDKITSISSTETRTAVGASHATHQTMHQHTPVFMGKRPRL